MSSLVIVFRRLRSLVDIRTCVRLSSRANNYARVILVFFFFFCYSWFFISRLQQKIDIPFSVSYVDRHQRAASFKFRPRVRTSAARGGARGATVQDPTTETAG